MSKYFVLKSRMIYYAVILNTVFTTHNFNHSVYYTEEEAWKVVDWLAKRGKKVKICPVDKEAEEYQYLLNKKKSIK